MYTKKIINLLTISITVILLSACGKNFDTQANSLNEKTSSTPYQTDEPISQPNRINNQDPEVSSQESFTPKQTHEPLNQKSKLGKLTVSLDKHMLQYSDGQGFFWMGDTAWEMSFKLNKSEVKKYFSDRANKGFNVIQISAVNSRRFLQNTDGERPFNASYSKPNEAYWKHIDYIITEAEKNGIYIALLPSWNSALISVKESKDYGTFIANRYKNRKNIIWIIGGDSDASKNPNKTIWNNLAQTIHNIVGENQLITYHPYGGKSSTTWFNNEKWLDFNMLQSGHCSSLTDANILFKKSYKESSKKPILDGEPRYETIEKCFANGKGPKINDRISAKSVRDIAYRQVFSGAFGHTYGHQSIWQMYNKEKGSKEQAGSVIKSWEEALSDPGSFQVGYLAKLMRSRPILGRVPKQSIIQSGKGIATQGNGYAMVYLPKGGSITVNLNEISNSVKAWWYNPETGDATLIDTYKTATQKFTTGSDDMVLVLDEKSKDFSTPGQ